MKLKFLFAKIDQKYSDSQVGIGSITFVKHTLIACQFKLPLQIVFATKELSLFHIRTQHNIMQSTSDEMHLCFKLEIGDNSKQMSERWEM